ncbi:MAG TPA: toxin TcdB middle/N-terminal domain-containing protein, partial [Polyangiaceae bacterium]|nr:toxin TcdB middle/N-terminal domain-containing protein [Polyangiaceae bacterium]
LLTDMDGNGRLDVVTAVGDGTWSVRAPLDVWNDRSSVLGVGKLKTIDDGYGVVRSVQYANAKDDPYTAHYTPDPEIVVSRIDTTVNDALQGEQPASEFFAYGQSHMVYHAAARRFVGTGFLKRVRARLRPSLRGKGNDVSSDHEGFAVVEHDYHPGAFSGYERAAFGGSPHYDYKLSGVMAPSAWPLLATLWSDPRSYAGSNAEWGSVVHTPAAQAHPDFDAGVQSSCADVADPFAPYAAPTPSELALCHQFGYVYPRIESAWEGDTAPEVSDRNVQRRKRIEKVDELGRPVLLRNEGDIFDPRDDLCEELSYASAAAPAFETTHTLSAVSSRSIGDCGRLLFLREWMTYDGMSAGKVQAGHRTGQTVEVHRNDTGAVTATYLLGAVELDERGMPWRVKVPHTGGATSTTQTTEYEYDAFGLVSTFVRTQADDLPFSFERELEYDHHRLLPITEFSVHGVTHHTSYDDHGRITARFKNVDGHTTLDHAVEYLGDSPGDPEGRRVHVLEAASSIPWQPGDSIAELVGRDGVVSHTTYYDRLGRVRFKYQPLGADYSDTVLQSNFQSFDAFGRRVFSASTGTTADDAAALYGTTVHYDLRGRVQCEVQGVGPQLLSAVPDPDQDVYPTCFDYRYEQHRAITTHRGPLDLAAEGATAGAFDVSVATAMGRVIETYREGPAGRVEWSKYGFDAPGNMQLLERAADPHLPASQFVQWLTLHDGLGRVVEQREPASSAVTHDYDSAGNVVRTAWSETVGGQLREHVLSRSFDGLKRITEETTGVYDPALDAWTIESATRFIHDEPCLDSMHGEDDHLLGREACVISKVSGAGGLDGIRSIYHAYDALGRRTRTTRVDSSSDNDEVREGYEYDGTRLYALSLALPDSDEGERVEYEYDSANRTRSVRYVRGPESELVYDAVARDELGRATQVDYGNGVTVEHAYRPDRRRELVTSQVSSSSFAYKTANLSLDALGRVVTELSSGPGSEPFRTRTYSYNVNHHLAEVTEITDSDGGVETYHERFEYDGLGNLKLRKDVLSAATTTFTRSTADQDRLCTIASAPMSFNAVPDKAGFEQSARSEVSSKSGVGFSKGEIEIKPDSSMPKAPPYEEPACSVAYNQRGSVVSSPSLEVQYDVRELVTRVERYGSEVRYRHGPDGAMEMLEVDGSGAVSRHELRFGPHVTRLVLAGTKVWERKIMGPGGPILVQRGPRTAAEGETSARVYVHPGPTANRLFTNEQGEVAQFLRYDAFGAVQSDSGASTSESYSFEQWNGGNALKSVSLTELGARLYEP